MIPGSSFTNVPINVAGHSGAHRDRSYNTSTTMNFIVEQHKSGASQALMVPFPGSVPYQSIATVGDRGMLPNFQDRLYKISGTTLYSYDQAKNETVVGTIPGSGRCVMVNDQNFLIITTGTQWFQFDGILLTEFFAPAGFSQGSSVDILGGFFIYDMGSNAYGVSDFGDPDNIRSINANTIASKSGDLKRIYSFDENVYLMSEKNIETHYLRGTSNPPIVKTNGGTMTVGLKDTHSVANSQRFVYFRGSDGYVYRFSSTQSINITSGAAANAFEAYGEDTATGYVIDIQGGTFYIITFLQNNATWVFSERSGELSPGINDWFQLSSGSEMDRYIGDFYVKAFDRHLIAKKNSGDILELDLDVFTDDGDTVVRLREIPPIHGGLLDKTGEGRRIEASWFTIVGKKGVGLITGQGVDPRVYLEISTDGGESYSNQEHVDLGRLGESMIRVTWYFTASAYEMSVRLKFYDPIFASIHSASMGLKFIGD